MKDSPTFFEDWVKLVEKLEQSGIRQSFYPALRALLAAARSRNDLRRLHDQVLRNDLRLRREDFLVVEEFWLKHLKPENPENGEPLGWMQAFFLVNLDAPKGTLGTYYAERIVNAAGKVYRTLGEFTYNEEGWQIVYSNEKRSGHGDHHYQVEMFKRRFDLACWLGPNSRLRVCIELWANDLDEKLTFALTSNFPKFDLLCAGGNSDKGSRIELVYELDGTGLVDKLEQGPIKYTHGPAMHIGAAPFFQALVNRLAEMGLPLTWAFTIEE